MHRNNFKYNLWLLCPTKHSNKEFQFSVLSFESTGVSICLLPDCFLFCWFCSYFNTIRLLWIFIRIKRMGTFLTVITSFALSKFIICDASRNPITCLRRFSCDAFPMVTERTRSVRIDVTINTINTLFSRSSAASVYEDYSRLDDLIFRRAILICMNYIKPLKCPTQSDSTRATAASGEAGARNSPDKS